MSTEDFKAELVSLFESGPGNPKFIDYDTAVVIIVFNCYEPSQDKFITVQMTIRFTLSGVLTPTPIKIICFSLDQQKQTSDIAIYVDLIQFFFCIVYL